MTSTMSIAELRKELKAKERDLVRLRKQRAKLAQQLLRVDDKIAVLGGEVLAGSNGGANGCRRRARNAKPLVDYVEAVLAKSKNGMRIAEIMEAVEVVGYKTSARDFYAIVAAALRGKQFKKVSRGVYTLSARARAKKR